ncbi:MAG: CRISPR-associated endonuclease Cas2 [Pirellulales bacterium]|nr:CRISPR-associated endonuclease Cas2 [Pirellulales bacterium]
MWVLAMFDLPVDTKKARRNYALFRKLLLKDGFTRMQFSVYARHCASEESASVHVGRVERNVPPDGEVRLITITDKQFERMRVFWGKLRKPPEPAPCQLELF